MNDNVMSREEIEKMLADAGQIDSSSADQGAPTADAPQEAAAEPKEQIEAAADNDKQQAKTVQADAGDVKLKNEDYLTKEEQDVLGEIGNICMGTSATTMYTLLGKRVNITTPRITVHTPKSLANEYEAPIVVVVVKYIEGITGKNLLMLKEYDVALMTDVLMGGDGTTIDPNNIMLDEMHMSAIREVMNQMVGSSATSLANILDTIVNISTPTANHMRLDEPGITELFAPDEVLVRICFDMEIEGLLKSEIMQVLPVDFAKRLADKLIGGQSEQAIAANDVMDDVIKARTPDVESIKREQNIMDNDNASVQAQQPTSSETVMPAGVMQGATNNVVRNNVEAKGVEYPSFDSVVGPGYAPVPENIALLSNVPMKVTVQLGKTKKKIKEILEFNNGSVIVLDKLAGEPVDVLVNGKHIAKGEVVVVDENYGVRITEIDSTVINETV